MQPFLCLIATVAIASLAPCISSAADLGDDAQQGSYVPPPQVRFVGWRYYAPYYYDHPALEAYYVFPSYFYPGFSYYYLGSYHPVVRPSLPGTMSITVRAVGESPASRAQR